MELDYMIISCPVSKKQITIKECADAALVYEELASPAQLPEGMILTEQNQIICLNCSHHQK